MVNIPALTAVTLPEPTIPEPSNVELTECMLEDLAKDVASYWKHLGRKLRVPNSKIERIHKDHHNYDDITEKAFAMLLEWKESSMRNTTKDLYGVLVEYGKVDTARRHFASQQ